MENYYEILEVSKNASSDVISKVFKYHIKKNHPDLFSGDEKIKSETKVQKLNEAYEVLSNPEKRKIYDETLKEYEKSKKIEETKKLNVLQEQNIYLNRKLKNYNRFIHEYFYEKASDVFNIIDNYDNNGYLKNKNNAQNSFKNTLLRYYSIVMIYFIMIFLFLLAISIFFKINIFKIIFEIFTKTS